VKSSRDQTVVYAKLRIEKDLKKHLMNYDSKDGYSEIHDSVLESLFGVVERVMSDQARHSK